MGVTLHYRGTLNDPGRLLALCDELMGIAQAMGWTTTRIDDDYHAPVDARLEHKARGAIIEGNTGLKGIVLAPLCRPGGPIGRRNRESHRKNRLGTARTPMPCESSE